MTDNTKRGTDAAPTASAPSGDATQALAAIEERLALTYRLCCGTSPKQSVGELLAVALKMPEWATVRAALVAAPIAPAKPVATVIKTGAERQWMSEALGALPDGMYSLYLGPIAPAIGQQADNRYREGYSAGWAEGHRACPKYEHMGEFACIDRTQCWEPCGELGKSKASAHLSATNSGTEGAADDFAKIVRASNGQQVLFFKESTADEGNVLHCVANFPEMQMDMKLGGIPDESFAASLEKVDIAMADKVIKQAADLGLGGAA
jgi:hypothetical protein